MGLDWNPMSKPLPGKETEFKELFIALLGQVKNDISLLDRIFGRKEKNREKLLEEFLSISTPPYECLDAPRVGFDDIANDWAKTKYDLRAEKDQSPEEFIQSMYGYYAVDLVTPHDGIPTYIAPHYECYVFRAQFLNDCVEIIGEEMLAEAYTSQLAEGAVNFGQRLMDVAQGFADKHGIGYLKDQRIPPDYDEDSVENKAHILFSASKWLLWWGERGHGYEADF